MSETSSRPTVGLAGADRVPPQALLLVSITSVQFGSALATHLFATAGPAGTVFLRLAFAALALTLVVRPAWRGLGRSQIRVALLFGAVMAGMNLAFYEALDRLPLGIAVTIEFAGPLGVAVALSRRRLDLLWALLAGIGIIVLAHPGGEAIDTVGLIFVLIAAALWAAYILVAKRVGEHFDGADGIALAMAFGALLALIPGIAGGGGALLQPRSLAIGFGVAMLSSAIPYTLEVEALRRIPANVFGVFMSLEPAVAALAGFVVLGQTLSAVDLVAIGFVVAASVGVSLAGAPARPPET
jgi:inner membrane transporter RhtA